jgi:fused signal recognition particle receptor
VGVAATTRLIDRVREKFADKTADEDLLTFVKTELKGLLEDPRPGDLVVAPKKPSVYLIAGVNGSGKTTSIAKLAQRLKDQGRTILLGACDTFRAAAADQLAIWAGRAGCEIVRGAPNADPASVAHDACQRALARNVDVLIVDTAGRLHTQTHLMRELEKIRAVLQRMIPGAPHEALLVIDATNGQNAIRQAEVFTKSIGCTGVILTKLDGTAKGGVVIAVRQTINLPVKFIGVGEALDDLQPFDADTFVESLFV